MRAVAYARVSSAAQRERDTIASQLRVLPAFIDRQGWTLAKPIDTYVDDGRTAKAGHLEARTGLTALLRDAAAGVFDVVVVVDLDRLTRSEDITERGAILGAFQRAGVRVASSSSGQVLDLTTSIGDLFGTLQAYFAAEENRKRSSRVAQGKLTALGRGRKPSGPTPYGLAYDRETGAWSVHPATGPIVAEILERVAGGESCMAIADDLHARGVPRPRGTWSRHRVWAIARARYPVGEWTGDKQRGVVVRVPPIVTEQLWQRAQASLLAHKKRGLRRTKHTYLLEGLARCGACGAPILIRSANGKVLPSGDRHSKAAYVCRARKLELRGVDRCNAAIVPVADADARVWHKLTALIQSPAMLDRLLAERHDRADDRDWQADASDYRKRIDRLDHAESALLARFSGGAVSERALDVELERINGERGRLSEQLRFVERAAASARTSRSQVDDAKALLAKLAPALPQASLSLRREVVSLLIVAGTATFEGAEIRFDVSLPAPTAAVPRSAGGAVSFSLADGISWFSHHESDVRIRLVA